MKYNFIINLQEHDKIKGLVFSDEEDKYQYSLEFIPVSDEFNDYIKRFVQGRLNTFYLDGQEQHCVIDSSNSNVKVIGNIFNLVELITNTGGISKDLYRRIKTDEEINALLERSKGFAFPDDDEELTVSPPTGPSQQTSSSSAGFFAGPLFTGVEEKQDQLVRTSFDNFLTQLQQLPPNKRQKVLQSCMQEADILMNSFELRANDPST